MARGTQFLQLVEMLRNELNRSTQVSVGVADVPRLKYQINKAYAALYDAHDWPHLRTEFPKLALAAGQRYYDMPAGLNVDRIESVTNWWNARPHPITRGINLDDFNAYDSTSDERSGPVLKWDIRYTDPAEQIEVWPIPAGNDQSIQFIGFQTCPKLVDDIDTCRLDDYLVVITAAMATTSDKDDKSYFAAEATKRLSDLQANLANNLPPIRLGLGPAPRPDPSCVILRVR